MTTPYHISSPRWHYPNGDGYGHFASHVRGLTCPFTAYHDNGGVWIDDSIAFLIVMFNQLGYTTDFCCSGLSFEHKGHNTPPDAYISFPGDVLPPHIPAVFKRDHGRGWGGVRISAVRKVSDESKQAAWDEWTGAMAAVWERGVAA